ncbi:MAG: DMT family transporter [Clostridiales bacterium]|nr:DMT family transporter [Clostridiales bacterium]
MQSSGKVGVVAVLAAGCFWGTTGIFVRILDGFGYSPLTIVFARMSLAFVILLAAFALMKKLDLLHIRLKDLWVFIGTGVSSAILLNLFLSMSTEMNTLALATVLLTTAPIFVVLLSRPIFGERITKMKVLALVVAFTGCVLVSGVIDKGPAFLPFGIFIGVLAGVGYALYNIMTRFALDRGYSSLTINVYSFGIGAAVCVPFTNFALVAATIADAPGRMAVILLLQSLFVSLFPYMLYTYGMKFMDTGKASILASIETVAATVFGFAIYHEVPTVLSVAGIVLMLFAVFLLNYKRPVKL